MSTYRGVNACLAWCLNSLLNVKALVGAFNQEKALVGAFSVIVKTDCGTDGSFYSTTQERTIINNFTPTLHTRHRQPAMDGWFSVAHLFVSSYNKLSPFNCSISTSV